jgi:uncharacterized protein with PIN domain
MSNSYDTQKFLCDSTVGRLCSYMRMTGFDTAMHPSHVPSDVLKSALDEERTILTRNSITAGMKLARDVVLLTEDDPWDQLRRVISSRHLTIETERILSRCLEDNEVLQPVPKDDVKGKVWPFVWATQNDFTTCPKCGRIFWPATHVEAMLSKLKSLGIVV